MEEIAISEFKAKCIAILRKVNSTGRPVLITRRGKPIARVEPAAVEAHRSLGSLRGQTELRGDIVYTDFTGEWEIEGEASS